MSKDDAMADGDLDAEHDAIVLEHAVLSAETRESNTTAATCVDTSKFGKLQAHVGPEKTSDSSLARAASRAHQRPFIQGRRSGNSHSS